MVSDNVILNAEYKLTPRDKYNRFVSRKYGVEINKLVSKNIEELTDKELNKAIRKYNSILSKRIKRLEEKHLLEISSGAKGLSITTGIDLHNFKLPSGTSFNSLDAKVRYLADISHSIDNETLSVAKAKESLNKMLTGFGVKDPSRLEPEFAQDLAVTLFEISHELGYQHYETAEMHQNEIEQCIEDAKINSEQALAELKMRIRNGADTSLEYVGNVHKALQNGFSHRYFDSDL